MAQGVTYIFHGGMDGRDLLFAPTICLPCANGWLHLKLLLVALLYAYHFYLYHLVKVFARDENTHSSRFYRFLNEAPVLVLLAIVCLAVVKFI